MKKRTYRAIAVKDADLSAVAEKIPVGSVFGIDIAKQEMFGAIMDPEKNIVLVLKWDHLRESRRVAHWAASTSQIEAVAMEPSGTYGDALRALFDSAGLAVFRLHPKQVKDAREIYDGVPSNHDAKASAIIAWLHFLGRSTLWPPDQKQERERALKATLTTLQLHEKGFQQTQNLLEGQLARYWPELGELLALDSVALLELLAHFGDPREVAKAPKQARERLRRWGRNGLKSEKISAVVASAEKTLGVPMIEAETQALRELAAEARRRQKALRATRRRLESLGREDDETARLAKSVGTVTASVLVCQLGPLTGYPNTGCLLKAAGLNLKEVSSGTREGRLSITKRGASLQRRYLYLAVLRWIQTDRWARAWYEHKVRNDGGKIKRKALIALMRKLLRGLWWVARGHTFDSEKLFDVQRLQGSNLRAA